MNLTRDQLNDLTFFRETIRWPYWPFCPVKRGDEIAFVYDGEKGSRIVYLHNFLSFMFDKVDIKSIKSVNYVSSYELVKEGWVVD